MDPTTKIRMFENKAAWEQNKFSNTEIDYKFGEELFHTVTDKDSESQSTCPAMKRIALTGVLKEYLDPQETYECDKVVNEGHAKFLAFLKNTQVHGDSSAMFEYAETGDQFTIKNATCTKVDGENDLPCGKPWAVAIEQYGKGRTQEDTIKNNIKYFKEKNIDECQLWFERKILNDVFPGQKLHMTDEGARKQIVKFWGKYLDMDLKPYMDKEICGALKNLYWAAGNYKGIADQLAPQVITMLDHPNPHVRARAAEALRTIVVPEALMPLLNLAIRESTESGDNSVYFETMNALNVLQDRLNALYSLTEGYKVSKSLNAEQAAFVTEHFLDNK